MGIESDKTDRMCSKEFGYLNFSRDLPAEKYLRQIYPFIRERKHTNGSVITEYYIDIYRMLDGFKTNSPALDHSAKKLLNAGSRGVKGKIQDLEESIWSIQQEINLLILKMGEQNE
jgi:hypothetical protein